MRKRNEKIAILGSTGSIGTQTLEVVRENKDIEVVGMAVEIILGCWKNKFVNFLQGL